MIFYLLVCCDFFVSNNSSFIFSIVYDGSRKKTRKKREERNRERSTSSSTNQNSIPTTSAFPNRHQFGDRPQNVPHFQSLHGNRSNTFHDENMQQYTEEEPNTEFGQFSYSSMEFPRFDNPRRQQFSSDYLTTPSFDNLHLIGQQHSQFPQNQEYRAGLQNSCDELAKKIEEMTKLHVQTSERLKQMDVKSDHEFNRCTEEIDKINPAKRKTSTDWIYDQIKKNPRVEQPIEGNFIEMLIISTVLT